MNYVSTKILYIIIMCTSILCAFFSQKGSWIASENFVDEESPRVNKGWLTLSFIIPWIFVAFTNIGVDYSNYEYIIKIISSSNYLIESSETLFNLLILFLKNYVTTNGDIVIFIFKTATMVLVYASIYMLRNRISVACAVAGYMLLFYLPSFYLISIYLAASIVLCAMALYIAEQRIILPGIMIIIAGMLHNAAFIFLPVYIVCLIMRKNDGSSKVKRVLFVIIYVIVLAGAGTIYNFALNNFAGFHYSGYSTNTFDGSGLMIVVLYAPLFYLIYKISARMESDERLKNTLFIFAASSCLFNILSYRFMVIERMEFMLMALYVLLIPMAVGQYAFIGGRKWSVISKNGLILILYILLRGYLVFVDRVTLASGLGLYQFFNPFE